MILLFFPSFLIFDRLRECHLCNKKFQRKQNADIHLLGVHKLTKEDLISLNRWNPKKESDESERPPEYMTRKSNWKRKKMQTTKVQQIGGDGNGIDDPEPGKAKKKRRKKDKSETTEVPQLSITEFTPAAGLGEEEEEEAIDSPLESDWLTVKEEPLEEGENPQQQQPPLIMKI